MILEHSTWPFENLRCGLLSSYAKVYIHSAHALKQAALSLKKYSADRQDMLKRTHRFAGTTTSCPKVCQNKCTSALHLPFVSLLVGECSFSFLSKKHFICWSSAFVCLWFSNNTMSHTTLTCGYNFLECFDIINLCRTFL